MIYFSQNNEDQRRNYTHSIRHNIYAIGNERAQIQRHNQQEMRNQVRQASSRTVPPVSNSNPDIQYEQEVEALRRIFKTWRRGNSLISNLHDKTCSI